MHYFEYHGQTLHCENVPLDKFAERLVCEVVDAHTLFVGKFFQLEVDVLIYSNGSCDTLCLILELIASQHG